MKRASLLLLLLPLFASCATLMKGPRARVRVYAPPEARVETLLGAIWPLALTVDAATQSWNDFGDQAIVFLPDSLDSAGASIVTTLSVAERRPPIGLMLRGGFGVSNPVTQAVLFFNQYSVDLGYEVDSNVSILVHHSFQTCMGLGDYEGTTGHHPHHYCFTTTRHTSVDAQVRVLGGLYAVGGVGIAKVSSDSVVVGSSYRAVDDLHETIPQVGFGLGYAGGYFYVEYRHHFGLARIPIGGDVTATLEVGTLHFGINAVF